MNASVHGPELWYAASAVVSTIQQACSVENGVPPRMLAPGQQTSSCWPHRTCKQQVYIYIRLGDTCHSTKCSGVSTLNNPSDATPNGRHAWPSCHLSSNFAAGNTQPAAEFQPRGQLGYAMSAIGSGVSKLLLCHTPTGRT